MRSDEWLYERLIEGDMSAFDALYDRYERPLFAFICRFLGDRADAEEVLQETFVAALEERGRAAEVRRFRPWIYTIARNLCLNRVRRRGREKRALAAATNEPREAKGDPERELLRATARDRLTRALALLPAPLGEIYALRATGLSYKDVAAILGVPIGTVKSRMHTLYESLRREMSHEL